MATLADQSLADPDAKPAQGPRPIPPMEVVTKGWWTLKVERVPVEVLEQQYRDEEQAREKKALEKKRKR